VTKVSFCRGPIPWRGSSERRLVVRRRIRGRARPREQRDLADIRGQCRMPLAGVLDVEVITSMSPGTSGSPSGSYDGPVGSDDWPSPPM